MRVLRLFQRGKGASPLGPLESDIMEIVWDSYEPVSVRQVHSALARKKHDLAYSTVKAVLTNLTTKGSLRCNGKGKSNYFSAVESREKFKEKTVSAVIDSLLKNHREPLIANLVDRVLDDEKTLREVERMIAKKRAELSNNA
jgi:predicted transcriptional regulator